MNTMMNITSGSSPVSGSPCLAQVISVEIPRGESPQITISPAITPYSTQRPAYLEALHREFEEWYYVEDPLYLEAILTPRLAIEFKGQPYWLLVVGAPGSGKSSVIVLLINGDPCVRDISKVTPRTFISGYNPSKEADGVTSEYDLYPKLVGKQVVVKDFSNLNTMAWKDRQQLFAILRESYDGSLSMGWGSQRDLKEYRGHFGMLVATTSAADQSSRMFNEKLGERFAKYRLRYKDREKVVKAAWDNAARTEERDRRLRAAVRACLDNVLQHQPPPKAVVPSDIEDYIISLADACAILRTPMRRDKGVPVGEPDPEVGSRLSEQFWKLGQSIAYLYGHNEFGETEIAHITKIAKDSMYANALMS